MIDARTSLVRNVALAIVNGGVTLVILLIAPLGLAAVIINTILVTIATFMTATVSDRVVLFLQPGSGQRLRSLNERDEATLSQQQRGDVRR